MNDRHTLICSINWRDWESKQYPFYSHYYYGDSTVKFLTPVLYTFWKIHPYSLCPDYSNVSHRITYSLFLLMDLFQTGPIPPEVFSPSYGRELHNHCHHDRGRSPETSLKWKSHFGRDCWGHYLLRLFLGTGVPWKSDPTLILLLSIHIITSTGITVLPSFLRRLPLITITTSPCLTRRNIIH